MRISAGQQFYKLCGNLFSNIRGILIILVITALYSIAMAGTHSKIKNLELPVAGIESFDIDCGAGTLEIKGGGNADKITVRAEIEVEDIDQDEMESFIKKNVRLYLERKGNRALLKSDLRSHGWGRDNGRINLIVQVPDNIDLDIRDGSGSLDISKIKGSVRIDDGSGSMELRGISGDLNIDDGSGSMKLSDITGSIKVDDGSGSMTIRNVGGDVVVRDGSGGISIEEVGGNVDIRESGSGSLKIRNVKGSVHRDD